MSQPAKRRSLSQRIGKKGESIFSEWAQDHRLTSQKVEEDVGVDFFCQVMKPLPTGVEEVAGGVLAVQVRSTEGKRRKRIKLDRVDVETALRLQTSFCLIGIDVGTREVFFRFLDEYFLEELREFLMSENSTMTIRLDSMTSDDALFVESLERVVRPSYQQKLRWRKSALEIQDAIPGGRLAIRQSLDGGCAIVSAPWITSLLDVEQDAQDTVARIHFETGELPQRNQGVSIKRSIASVPTLVDGPVLLAGVLEGDIDLKIAHAEVTAHAKYRVRHVGDETAYVGPTGLVLAFSAARRRDQQWVHEFRHFVTDVDVVSLGDPESDIEFLKLMLEGAQFGKGENHMLPIQHWGSLSLLGSDVSAVERVCAHVGFSLKEVYLKDLTNEEFLLAIDTVRAALDEIPLYKFIPAFVLDDGGGDPLDSSNWMPAGFRAPIVVNLKSRGLVVWFEGEGTLYRRPDGIFAGFRADKCIAWSFERRSTRFVKSVRPELWLLPEWPAIQVFTPIDEIKKEYKRGEALEFGGDIWPLSDSV